jgi:hypothetical protein
MILVRRLLRLAPLFVLLGYVFHVSNAHLDTPRFSDRDEAQHFVYALNLAEFGVFSLGRTADSRQPDAIRTPGYPAFLALAIAAGEIPPYEDIDCFLTEQGACRSIHERLLRAHHLAFLALLACSYLVALRITRSVWLAALCSLLSGVSLAYYALDYRSEVLTTILLLVHVDGLHRLVTGSPRSRLATFEAGVAGGLLVLTTPSFVVWLYLVLLAVPAVWLLARRGWRVPSPVQMGFVALAMALLVGGWIARNSLQLGRPVLSERGGAVMSVRAEYDTMSWREYRAAWSIFSPKSSFITFVMGKTDVPDSELLLRSNRTSYYRRSRHLFMPLYFPTYAARNAEELESLRLANRDLSAVAARLPPGESLDDSVLRSAALAVMRAHWQMHAALTPVFLSRGLGMQVPFLVFALMVIAWRRDQAMAWFIAPVIVSALFHAALTHYIPRYGFPLMPLTWVATLWAVGDVIRWLRGMAARRWAGEGERGAPPWRAWLSWAAPANRPRRAAWR